jgi:hypothetical protein
MGNKKNRNNIYLHGYGEKIQIMIAPDDTSGMAIHFFLTEEY